METIDLLIREKTKLKNFQLEWDSTKSTKRSVILGQNYKEISNEITNETLSYEDCLMVNQDNLLAICTTSKTCSIFHNKTTKLFEISTKTAIDSIYFSPLSTYIVIYERHANKGDKNLHIYEIKTANKILSIHQKHVQHNGLFTMDRK